MDPNAHAHQMRRHRRFAIPLHLDPIADGLKKRLTPLQLASIQSEMSVSANRASSAAAAALRPSAAVTTRAGANAALISTTAQSVVSTFSAAPNFTVGQPLANTPSATSSAAPISSAAPPSSSSTTTSRSIPSSSTAPLSTSTVESTTPLALPSVVTRTTPASSTSSTSISDSLPTVSSAASNSSSSSSGLSTGAVVGIVLAVLIGVVALGSCIGWLYRKFAQRGYKPDSNWRKLDEDITPFPNEKDVYNDDIYGGNAAPIIGSRRALADHAQPVSRPMTEYGSNRAGVGSGPDTYGADGYNSYPATYGVDVQGRPYNAQAGRVPAQVQYHDEYEYDYSVDRQSPPSPPTSRQLVGPGYSPPQLVPVALGRPAPPRSYSDIAHREDFADEPMSAGMPYEPMTARTNEWAGTAQQQSRRISTSKAPSPPNAAPLPLPTFAPLSPMNSDFGFPGQSQPLAMYENEPARQKQLYGEVAAYAGFPEPITPHSAGMDNTVSSQGTFNTGTTHSSFSATEHGVRLPIQPPMPMPVPNLNVPAPPYASKPYQHGRPLSPLTEVATPSTYRSALPVPGAALPSSSIGQGHTSEYNPFDNLPVPRTLLASHSAASSGGNSFPSPRFPPPSPGGSLPASVTDSPRRWSGQGSGNAGMARRSRGESMFDGEDAYGGI